jgi:hypothetical protein
MKPGRIFTARRAASLALLVLAVGPIATAAPPRARLAQQLRADGQQLVRALTPSPERASAVRAIRRLARTVRSVEAAVAVAQPGRLRTRARVDVRRLWRALRLARRSLRADARGDARRAHQHAVATRRLLTAERRALLRLLRGPPQAPAALPPPVPPQASAAVPPPPVAAPPPVPTPAPPPPLSSARVSGFVPQALPVDDEPYNGPAALALDDPNYPVDADGVREYEVGGELHPHPTVLGNYGLAMVNGYRVTGTAEYLRRAEANANALLDHAVTAADAIFFSYTFAFDVFGNPAERLLPPWHSGMAQGQILLLMHRLYEVTGDEAWREAADRVYAGTFWPRSPDAPWFCFVDADGYLWFEEYPTADPPRVFNGHNTALTGYWKHALVTGDPEARRLFDAAATTSLHYARILRRPGDLSVYSVRTPVQSAFYHGVHIKQLRAIARMTGDARFSALADAYASDTP